MMFEPGSMIGKYRIIKNLGTGGMADVYLAEDSTNRRQLALKILPPEFARDPERTARFQKEVEHLTALDHPNIINVHDVGFDDGCFYYAMTHMTGGNLKHRIQQGMSISQTLNVLRQIADALHFAHAKGLIHRDIKPENILFDAKGQAVLTDLGIARAVGSRTRMTKTGMSIGTPHYMSPEQARGKDVDARSDIYSLGVVFFEMLTGNLPYDSEDTFAVAFQHVSDPLPELPQDLAVYQPLIDRMMAKEQKGRFADASVLLEAVSHLQAGRTIKRPAATTRVMESPQEPKIGRTTTEVRERVVEDYPTPQQKTSWVGKNKWVFYGAFLALLILGGVYYILENRDFTNSLDMDFIYIESGTFMMGSPSSEYERFSEFRQQQQEVESYPRHPVIEKWEQDERYQVMSEDDRKATLGNFFDKRIAGNATRTFSREEMRSARENFIAIHIAPPPAPKAAPDEMPDENEWQYKVALSKGYYMQTTPVTQGQWIRLMGSNPSPFIHCGDHCPVNNVSWNEAQAFINKLNMQERTTKYRLPTEAEWEYAARAGSTTIYSFGNRSDDLGRYAWYKDNSGGRLHPVAQKEPNAWGLYDMHGNILEWVADRYGTYPSSAVTDPTGTSSGALRVLRGGAFNSSAGSCRSAKRFRRPPDTHSLTGFRLVLDP